LKNKVKREKRKRKESGRKKMGKYRNKLSDADWEKVKFYWWLLYIKIEENQLSSHLFFSAQLVLSL
jgi:hypothetical protein